MTSLLHNFIEALKTMVLEKSGFSTITPCDCKVISNLIFIQTKLSLSETTLKRVYGFAYSKFKPSLFTINVMAKYCGYMGWDDFCLKHEQTLVKSSENDTSWETLKMNAGKITNFTLQVLRNKAGIPYNLTIKRRFTDAHFDKFLAGEHTATLLSAPAGYGKTIALCHWVEERIQLNTKGTTNDVILFFSTNALMNAFLSGRDLNEWLLALLGYSADKSITALFDDSEKKEGNFFLIIDDLDEHFYKPEQFKLLLDQLIDIYSLYKTYPWFKLIITMRSGTWINNKHEIDNDNWFKGFTGDESWATNVPLFSRQEVQQLSQNINPDAKSVTISDVLAEFNHPLYFQVYYKEHKQNFRLSDIDHVCIYELIATFILNKVYLGHYSAEKVLLLKGLVEQMDFITQNYNVPKINVNALIKQYPQAYNELVGVGFIREVNNSTGLNYQTDIEFSNSNFLEYTIAKTLLNNNKSIFDAALIETINTQFAGNEHKLPILKWSLLYAIKTDQQLGFDVLSQTTLSLTEKSDLIIFLGDLLDKQWASANRSESLTQYFKKDCSRELFNYFFGLEFINPYYKKTLHSLLKFGLSNRKRILIYTTLASSAVMRLDMADLEMYLTKLKAIPTQEFNKFAIDPLKCLDALHRFFKYGEIKKDVFVDITRFYFNPPQEGNYFEKNASNDIIHLLSAYTSLLLNNPLKTLRYIKVLEDHYKSINFKHLDGYTYFLGIVKGNCYYQMGDSQKLEEIYTNFYDIYKQNNNTFTDYMKNMFYALRLKTNILLKNYTHIIEDTRSHAQIASENKLSKLFILQLLINNKNIEDIYPQFNKQCLYDHAKLLRETDITTTIWRKQSHIYST